MEYILAFFIIVIIWTIVIWWVTTHNRNNIQDSIFLLGQHLRKTFSDYDVLETPKESDTDVETGVHLSFSCAQDIPRANVVQKIIDFLEQDKEVSNIEAIIENEDVCILEFTSASSRFSIEVIQAESADKKMYSIYWKAVESESSEN